MVFNMDLTRKFSILIGLVCLSNFADCTAKLNVPRVLLPVFKNTLVNFTLEVSGDGCYRWTTSRPDLIQIKELFYFSSDCSKEAVITVLSRDLTKKTVMVIAEDINSGLSLRADVILDVISSLKIITKSRELYVEEPPQMFEVRAYDIKGNEFTTLEGVEFQWRVSPRNTDSDASVVALIAFCDSPYETPPSVAHFDSMGKHGHITLVEGIKTGSAKVSVQLPQQEYSLVPPAKVNLVVVANLILEPSTAYILPGTTIDFRLFQVRQGRKIEIEHSNQQFVLISENEDIAVVKQRSVTGLALGKVEIAVHDTSILDQSTIKLPSALLGVIEPHYLTISMLPFNTWTLTVNQKATIVPEVFGINDEKIWISNKASVYNTVPEDIYQISSESENGTITGIAYKTGQGRFITQLRNYKWISAEKTLIVFPTVTISPEFLALPWVPDYSSRIKGYSLLASGGDNNYVWTSEDSSIVEVTQSGGLIFNGFGSTTVTVYMKNNKYSKATARIHLLPPDELVIYNSLTEAIVGDDIYLHLSLYGTIKNATSFEKVLFSTCSFLNFEVITSYPFEKGSDPVNLKPKEGACAVKNVSSYAVGYGKVIVSLDTNEGRLYADTLVSSYNPLISLQPARNERIVLALGSSYDIVFSGGFQPYFGPLSDHLSFPESNFLVKTIIKRPDLYVYRVTCIKVSTGTFELKLVSRPIGFTGIEVSKAVSISCKVPHSFEIHSKSRTGCSEIFPQRFISYPLTEIRFDVILYDDNRIPFTNATSVLFHWLFVNDSIARFNDEYGITLEEKDHIDFKTGVNHYITATIFGYLGDVKGEGYMNGYHDHILSNLEVDDAIEYPSDFITFMLSVVREPTMEPNFLSIFNHPNNIVRVKVRGGSGHFSFEPTNNIVSIKYNYRSRSAEISPLNEGSGQIIVIDKCLPDIYPPKIEFQVVSVASLVISSSTKVQEGHRTKVTVQLLDSDEKPLTIPPITFSHLGLNMLTYNPFVASFEGPDKSHVEYSKGIIELYLMAKNYGETTIRATWMDIYSNSVTIQVFPRLKFTLRSITLTVGSEMQLKVTGGPSVDTYVHFSVTDPTIVSVLSTSIAKGLKPGTTTVIGRSVGYQGEVYSRDSIDIQVIPLNGIHIVAPTTKLGLGNVMPVYASGIPHHISPLLLGSITPPLKFKWQVSLPNVVHIRDTLYNTNVQVTEENKLSIRVFAANPGRTVLYLTVVGLNVKTNFNSSIEIEVFNSLKWTSPNVEFTPMLMAPNTKYHVQTNSIEKEFRSIQSTDIWNSKSDKPLLRVLPDGLLESGSNFGSAVVAAKTYDINLRDIALVVQVKPVHYLMINIATVLEISEEVKSLPRGLYLNISISYHDQYGYKFFVPPFTKPVCECNICSKIHIEYSGSNHSIITSLASSGNVILQIHDVVSQTQMEDYIKIPVDNYIIPNRYYLTVGEIICYWTPLVSQNGVWSTDNNIMHINSDGIAKAERTGMASVMYSLSFPEPVMLASLSVEILPLESYLIGPVTQRIITNVVGSNYTIPVFLINEKQMKEPSYSKNCKDSNFNKLNMPFTCELYYTSTSKLFPVDKIFSVHAEFNSKMGSYACVISPIKGPAKETSAIETNLTLSVTNPNRKSIYETFFLNFHPQFHVNVDKLVFGQDEKFRYVIVTGSIEVINELFVETMGRKVITVTRPLREGSLYQMVVYNSLPENEVVSPYEEIYLVITSHLTRQTEKIPVIFRLEGKPSYQQEIADAVRVFVWSFLWLVIGGLTFHDLASSVLIYSGVLVGVYFHFYSRNRDDCPETNSIRRDRQSLTNRNQSTRFLFGRENLPATDTFHSKPLMASVNFLNSTRDSLQAGLNSSPTLTRFNNAPNSNYRTSVYRRVSPNQSTESAELPSDISFDQDSVIDSNRF